MSAPLFRNEVSIHAQQAWLGRIVLIRPISFTMLVGVAGLMAIAVLFYLWFGQYTKKATVSGMLVPDAGLVKVSSPQGGVVLERFAAEGDRIEKGAPLLVVADLRQSAQQQQLGATLARRHEERREALARQDRFLAELAEAERRSITARRDGLRAEATRIEDEMRTLELRAALAKRSATRAVELAASGFLSQGAVDSRREDEMEQALRGQALARNRSALQREVASAEADLAVAAGRARTQRSVLEGQRAALEQEQLERDSQYRVTLTAPRAGVVSAMLAQPGQAVTPAATLATIVPEGSRLEAHLFAPSRAMGFVRTGQDVLLRFPSFPYQKFGMQKAQVVAISRNALSPAESGVPATEALREPLYRIRVALPAQSVMAYGRAENLQPGMQVDADVLLDRRRLIEWIFEPLISLAGRA